MAVQSEFQFINRGDRKVIIPMTPAQTAELIDALAGQIEECKARIQRLEEILLRRQIAQGADCEGEIQ